MKKNKVIVIGAKGMLGQSLVEVFGEDKKYIVIGWDIEEIDITQKKEVLERINREKPNLIINAAAYNAVDKAEESEEEFEKAKKVNGEGPKFLAEVARKNDAIFVHYGSDYVFDGEKGEYLEDDLTNPISNYGISKELGEKNIRKVGGQYYLIRTSKLFGRPAITKEAKRSFFDTMLELAEKNEELKVVNEEKSCFCYVKDLARATRMLIESKLAFGTYHLVNEGAVTWYDGVRALFKLAGIKNVRIIPVSSKEFPRLAKRPKSSVLLNTKFPKLRNYEEAVKEWLKECYIKSYFK